MKILSILARIYKKLDIELFSYCAPNHAWFLDGMLHRAEMVKREYSLPQIT